MSLSQLSRMRATLRQLSLVLFAAVAASWAVAQTAAPAASATEPAAEPAQTESFSPASIVFRIPANPETAAVPLSVRPLLGFRDTEIKFSITDLTSVLRDHRHEGWVLAAYPDPKTGRPLIGAGFSLDLPERQHPQSDPLNPHSFVEPSSAELWQAAGLEPAQLQEVLEQFHDKLAVWKATRRSRRRIWPLDPQITDDQASNLLRIAAIQADRERARLLPQFRRAQWAAADGAEPAGLSDGREPRGVRQFPQPDQQRTC